MFSGAERGDLRAQLIISADLGHLENLLRRTMHDFGKSDPSRRGECLRTMLGFPTTEIVNQYRNP
jgi:hypothetical protein